VVRTDTGLTAERWRKLTVESYGPVLAALQLPCWAVPYCWRQSRVSSRWLPPTLRNQGRGRSEYLMHQVIATVVASLTGGGSIRVEASSFYRCSCR
jgi:hypothetical protein